MYDIMILFTSVHVCSTYSNYVSFFPSVSVGDNLMPLIERDFPFIHVSPSTMHRLMERQIQQVKALTSSTQNSHNTSTVKKINEMELRYRTLLQVIKKELEHTKRMVSHFIHECSTCIYVTGCDSCLSLVDVTI